MASALAAHGHKVAVNYGHDQVGAERVADAVRAAGGTVGLYRFDVTDEAAVGEGVTAIIRELGVPDVVINNAIGKHDPKAIEEQTWQDHLEQLAFCVKAPLLLLKSVVTEWKARRSGCLINIGSEVVNMGNPMAAPYVGAKAAMVGLTRSWASELGPYGIRVNLIEPGFIPVERHAGVSQATFDAYTSLVPMKRMGVPDDIAAMAVFLASPGATFITGQTFAVNGGRTLA